MVIVLLVWIPLGLCRVFTSTDLDRHVAEARKEYYFKTLIFRSCLFLQYKLSYADLYTNGYIEMKSFIHTTKMCAIVLEVRL